MPYTYIHHLHRTYLDNYISIDKKDYLLKESQPVELDEEGELKKRAIAYEIKMNKAFR